MVIILFFSFFLCKAYKPWGPATTTQEVHHEPVFA